MKTHLSIITGLLFLLIPAVTSAQNEVSSVQKSVREIGLNIRPNERAPRTRTISNLLDLKHDAVEKNAKIVVLARPEICHKPLYFEQRQLERHGVKRKCQLVGQTAHFFSKAVLFPTHAFHPKSKCWTLSDQDLPSIPTIPPCSSRF